MDFQIGVRLPVSLPPGSGLPQAFPVLSAAVQAVAAEVQRRWVGYAAGAPLPDGRQIMSRTGAYARSIQMVRQGDLAYRIESQSPIARVIESGARAFDMKQALRTSSKVRLTKDGKRYLIIPFRHGAPGAVGFRSTMPDHVHELARALSASRVKFASQVPNALGIMDVKTRQPVLVTRRSYSWGDRLPEGLVSKRRLHHKTDPFAGMVRFDAPQGRHSQFLTFRMMHEDSRGWIRAAQPGYWPARTVAQEMRGRAEGVFRDAMEEDIRRYLASAS